LLNDVAAGRVSPDAALRHLSSPVSQELPYARIDHHRALRQGFPEVVLAEGKSDEQVLAISRTIAGRGDALLVTRVSEPLGLRLTSEVPGVIHNGIARTVRSASKVERDDGIARTVRSASKVESDGDGNDAVLILTGGTSDLPVAEEARETLVALGIRAVVLCDVGVAGIHRVLEKYKELHAARVTIVVAGMDGALPSVVGGLVACPVIAVPSSIGYGASFGGLAALLAMLNSCASGVVVVNIDNGFGAAVAAARILRG
jgi:hypothetical protein